MRILMVHTCYRQPGGEDRVFAAEVELLRAYGHAVRPLVWHNRDLALLSPGRQLRVMLWNEAACRRMREALQAFAPDVVHVHNTFPLASPAVLHVARAMGVPVVMTLHNYRLLCLNALFFRKGRVCTDCARSLPWRGVLRGCYRNRPASLAVAAMLALHRWRRTWDCVDRFIVLTAFARQQFVGAGFPEERLVVKPNFVYPDPGPGEGRGRYVLFVGRLTPEKGVGTLLNAWQRLEGRIPLWIVGDGPLAPRVREASTRWPNIRWLGYKTPGEVQALMGEAVALVFPSEWYEGFPMVLVEALARGTPVITSALGAQATLITHGVDGLHFRAGDPGALAEQVAWLWSHPREQRRMRRHARDTYARHYTAAANYNRLMQIYEQVVAVSLACR